MMRHKDPKKPPLLYGTHPQGFILQGEALQVAARFFKRNDGPGLGTGRQTDRSIDS